MAVKLKKLNKQVMVITGASSGIGLATARRAAKAGARLVLAARNDAALAKIVRDIRAKGGTATYVAADVSRRADVEKIADTAERTYGHIDTWVNDAGLSVYGRFDQIPESDARTLFDINYWGLVYGSIAAAQRMRRTGGGCIINLGSIASDVGLPLQSQYTATKAAIRGFTDTMRMELREEGAPIAVSLIKPAAIATPFPDHARNRTTSTPTLPPPVYRPEDVASSILHAAEHGDRDYYVGGGARLFALAQDLLPAAVDFMGARAMSKMSTTDKHKPIDSRGSLERPMKDGDERGRSAYPVQPALYTRSHPVLTGLLLAGAGVAALAFTAKKAG